MSTPEKIEQFVGITGASPQQAQFFLESSAGNVEAALTSFFENGGADDNNAPEPISEPTYTGPRTLSGAPAPESSFVAPSGSAGSSGRSTPFRAMGARSQRVATLRDMNEESKKPSEFFAGGEKSGLSVQNPFGGDDDEEEEDDGGAGRALRSIFEKAQQGTSAAQEPPRPRHFIGTGNLLGSEDNPAPLNPVPVLQQPESEEEDNEVVIRHITFWQDGFSVEDGDLLSYEDNQSTLDALNNGQAPLSLLNVRYDQKVELRIAKRMGEKWVRGPKPKRGPWEGSGNRLGSPTASTSAAPPPPAARQPTSTQRTLFSLDTSKPTTSIQIRLSDGSRLVAKFNTVHTIGDVRDYINHSQAGAGRAYILQSTFPTRDLVDENKTIEEEGLSGSVIVQKNM